MKNFEFLKDLYPELCDIASFAEKYVYSDPNGALFKIRILAEKIVRYMVSYDGLEKQTKNTTQFQKLAVLRREGLLPQQINDIFHILRKDGNDAGHEGAGDERKALENLELAHDLSVWFMEVYGDITFKGHSYEKPVKGMYDVKEKALLDEKIQKLVEEQLEEKLKIINAEGGASKERKIKAFEKADSIYLSEAQTREIIDEQLRQVGWEADSVNMSYAKGARPEKGRNMAIAEWPTDSKRGESGGRADYALFIGEKMVGLIEAKRLHKDVSTVLDFQAKDYATNIKKEHKMYCKDTYKEFYVPFIFATNGRGYIEQFKTKSGIWFQDVRDIRNAPKALKGWISPSGLEDLMEKNIGEANKKLEEEDYIKLQDSNGLGLRKYQIEAIKATEEAIVSGKDKVLLAMATGTGKTRTALGMIYRFLKAKRFKRILYLVDRTALGVQTFTAFENVKIDDFLTLTEIYGVKGLEDKKLEKELRLQIATVQGMVQKVLFNEGESMPSVSDYDCIIVDEAHRGYLLDKELSEDETYYKDEQEYRSRYKAVIDYFEAVKIAITATPALHTSEIFGKPVYTYSYRDAVIDGYLVDQNVPHTLKTKLSTKGIRYNKGDTLPMFDPVTHEIMNSEELADEVIFGVEDFNRNVITEGFNRAVLEEIFKDEEEGIDVFGEGKTLIFAVNDNHADMIVNIIKENFEKEGIPTDKVMKITGSIENGNSKKIQDVIKRFRNEVNPNIAVTVDLLTTGIDVPQITNLVFMRFVKSRILYEQMKGRATRLCDEIGKTHYEIYDAVGVCKIMDEETNMKPVVTNVRTDFTELIDSLKVMPSQEQKKNQIDMLIAKMRRGMKRIDERAAESFKILADGKSPEEVIEKISSLSTEAAVEYITGIKEAFNSLKSIKKANKVVIYSGKDEIVEHSRDYEITENPFDYIEKFKEFLEKNKDVLQAIKTIATKPSDLTRKDLRELKIILDNNHFTEKQLQTAWKELKNEDIVVDIITWIRQQLTGSPLIPIEKRVDEAIRKVKENHPELSKKQLTWLDRISKQIKEDYILNRETFEAAAFENQGGYRTINRQFDEKLDMFIDEINEHLYG